MFVGKQFDLIMGVDIHIIQPPGPVPPVPIPHPFIGIVFDPIEFIPKIGAAILVNGIPRAQAGTTVKGMPPHFPIGGFFVKVPSNDGEIFMGSMTVNAEFEPLAFLGNPVLTCHDVGMTSIPRPNRMSKSKPKSLVLPTSVLLPIPKGLPTIVGSGALMISIIGTIVKKVLNLKKVQKGTEWMVGKTRKMAGKVAREITEEIAEEVVEISAIIVAKIVARDFASKAAKEAVEEAVIKFIDDGIEEVIEEVTGNISAEIAEHVAEEVTLETIDYIVSESIEAPVDMIVKMNLESIEKNAFEKVMQQRNGG